MTIVTGSVASARSSNAARTLQSSGTPLAQSPSAESSYLPTVIWTHALAP